MRPRSTTVCCAFLCGLLPGLSAAAAPVTTVDDAARLQRASVGGHEALVGVSRSGILLLIPASRPRLDSILEPERGSFLQIDDGSARVVFCPTPDALARSEQAVAACIAAAGNGAASAFQGFGRVKAGILADAAGVPQCPASVLASASVRSPGGDLFDVTGSIVLAPEADGSGCRVVQDDVQLAYAGPGPARTPAAAGPGAMDDPWSAIEREVAAGGLDWSRWERIEPLLRLDEAEWAVLEELLFLTPDDWAAIEANSPALGFGQGDTFTEQTAVTDYLSRISSKLEDARSRVIDIRNTLGENRPDVKGLVSQLAVPRLRELMSTVQEDLAGVLGLLQELRNGFDSFAPGGECAAGTPCAGFKAELSGVLDDLERGFANVQKLRCFDKPDLEIFELDTSLFRTLAIDRAPTLVLYVTKRFLERIPEWNTTLGEAIDEIPEGLLTFCEEEGESRLAAPTALDEAARCARVLEVPEIRFSRMKSVVGYTKGVFDLLIPWIDDKVTIGGTIVALGGGGAVASIKTPLKPIVEDLKAVTEGIGVAIEARAAFRSSCDKEKQAKQQKTDTLEADVKRCTPSVAAVVDGIDDSAAIVQARIDQMEDAGFSTGEAQTKHDDALAEADARDGYQLLCEAYRELVRTGTGAQTGAAVRSGRSYGRR